MRISFVHVTVRPLEEQWISSGFLARSVIACNDITRSSCQGTPLPAAALAHRVGSTSESRAS